MKRSWILTAFGLALLAGGWVAQPRRAVAQSTARVQWVWFNEGDPAKSAPAGTRYFRKVFKIDRPIQQPVDESVLDITATEAFTVWVNGAEVGKGDNPKRVYAFDVKKHLIHGDNIVAVEARHKQQGPAGLLVRLGYIPNGMSKMAMVSDGSWKASQTAGEGWQQVSFDDKKWQPVRVLGNYGQAGPVSDVTWDQGGDDRFSVPPGFRVEMVVPSGPKLDTEPKQPFSLINMTFDNKGRLLVSREMARGKKGKKDIAGGGGIYLCTQPDKNGVFQSIKVYCDQVKNCQGMCWVKDALLLVGNGPQGAGLYRVRDTNGDDKTDEVTLLHAFPKVQVPGYGTGFQGGMGEHGPHAIVHGPDGWLYLMIGNHAWAGVDKGQLAGNSPLRRWPTGLMGPDQGQPNTTEDVLLPRLNDGRGHASNILAPGGTIWRLDHEGKNWSLVTAGFRNAYDLAFSPSGELFTFDSDMEWDENLPWYRAVRVCHCPMGADFVWRTGAANTPDYYIDSLPPIAETGRGSPVGVEFYDHHVYPKKYQGAYFLADWAIGTIFVAFLERDGASYKAKVERFCTGAPMNVTDCAVGSDGALYFTMGGRGTQGGVYRIVHTGPRPKGLTEVLGIPQPFSAWGRECLKQRDPQSLLLSEAWGDPVRALMLKELFGVTVPNEELRRDAKHESADLRAQAIRLLGVHQDKDSKQVLVNALKDKDAMVRRCACEALIRVGIEPPVQALWPLLKDNDRFVRHAARLVLERIDPKKWADRIGKETTDVAAWNGIIALCQTNKAAPYGEKIFSRLRGAPEAKDTKDLLDYLRTVQMALIHVPTRPIWVAGIAEQCEKLFPDKDWRVNRELAILLTAFQREKQLDRPVVGKLFNALVSGKDDRQQQIHYAYCLRLLKDGWTPEQKKALAVWYNGTQTWRGGHSYTPFLENIYREALQAYDVADRRKLLEEGQTLSLPALVLAQRLQLDRHPELLPDLEALSKRLAAARDIHRGGELQQALVDAMVKTATAHPTASTWPFLVLGLDSANPLVRGESLSALRKVPAIKPKTDDAAPYRALLQATSKMTTPKERWEAVELLRQWNGRSFGAAPGKADVELKLWARWFGQSFPKEPPLPNVEGPQHKEPKYKFSELLAYLDKSASAGTGDVARGRLIFAKAQCIKCHKHGKDGEGIGPDLTSLAKRFKRADILDSLLYPSKVISDQYRSVTIVTTSGQSVTGLPAVQGDTISLTLNDASKVTLKRDEIDMQVASLVSVMPDGVIDTLTQQEIADLFAFLESEPR